MAVWQYQFHIVPASVHDVDPRKQLISRDGLFDAEALWLERNPEQDLFEEIGAWLPKTKSWSDEVIIFGKVESHCLEVVIENGNILDAGFRLDFSQDYDDMLRRMIEFVIRNGLAIISQQWKILELNLLSIKAVIERSAVHGVYHRLLRGEDPFSDPLQDEAY